MKRILLATAAVVALATSACVPPDVATAAATATPLELSMGDYTTKLYPNKGDGTYTQNFTVKNNSAHNYDYVFVSCGFFNGDRLVGSGNGIVHDLAAGQEGYGYAMLALATGNPDHTKCRFDGAQ
jgi:hypothetical protein